MRIQDGILDEIITAQQKIRELQKDTHEKYNGIILEYFILLEKNPNFNYIVNSSPMQLLAMYEQKINSIVEMTYNPNFSEKQNVLNVLEYNRIMSMYENLKKVSSEDKKLVELSKHPIFLALTGKGICWAQAKFVRDILIHMGINAGIFTTSEERENRMDYLIYGHPHQNTTVQLYNNKNYCIDPTVYTGSSDAIQFDFQLDEVKKKLANAGLRTDFYATKEEVKKSRDFVFPNLIKKLGIDEISKQLNLENKDNLQKQCTIISFIESRLNLTGDLETKVSSANLNGFNIEVGKLMELFFYQNNIAYSIECEDDKRNSIYKTKMGSIDLCLCPKLMYDNKAKILMNQTHYFIRNGKKVLLYSLNVDMYKTYMQAMNQGRVDVLHLAVNNICKANNMDINTFLQAPMDNMKKYAPEINVDAFVMRTLVKSIQSELPENRNSKLTAQRITQGVAKVGTKTGMDRVIKETLQIANGKTFEISNEKYGREIND